MKYLQLPCALALGLTLAACGENEIRDPARAEIKALATGAESSSASTKNFRRAQGELIELETGLVNIYPLGLEPCATASARRRVIGALGALLPTAQAHGSHVIAAPPGVFDAVRVADGVEQDLGSLSPAAGSYCGLRVAVLPVVGEGELSGRTLAIGPCFYAESAGLPAALAGLTPHECWTSFAAEASLERVLDLGQPLDLGGGKGGQKVVLTVDYSTWFDGLDMEALQAGEADAVAALTANVLASITASRVTTP
jgi:hypothetical protein